MKSKIKVGILVVASLGLAAVLAPQYLSNEPTIPAIFAEANASVHSDANDEISQKSVTSKPAEQVVSSHKPLPFVVAADYNDIFAAATMIANATNQEVEKKWLNFRLGTRVARENAERAKAELQKVQYEYDKEELALRTEKLISGDLSALTDIINQQAPMSLNQQPNNDLRGEDFKHKEIPEIKLLAFTPSSRNSEPFFDINVNGRLRPKVAMGHSFNGFSVTGIIESSRCISLSYESMANSTYCME